MTDKTPTTLSAYLGQGERGAARKAALTKLARDAGHMFNGAPSIGRWLCDLADAAGTKPPLEQLDDSALHITAHKSPQQLDDLADAIIIRRIQMTAYSLAVCEIETITGDSAGWSWMNYIIVIDPATQRAVHADLAECRVLLAAVQEMGDPAAAFERWLPKVKEVRDE